MISAHSSGSSRSAIVVDPLTSQKRTVTTRRSPRTDPGMAGRYGGSRARMRRTQPDPAFFREGRIKVAMTKTETVRELSERAQIDRKQANQVLEELAKMAYENARDGFTIPGLGKLVLVDRKARMGRNPATGEAIQIPAKRVLKFRIAKQAKDAVLAKRGK